jgi:predicted metal-dependent phosphoesterase TrpH
MASRSRGRGQISELIHLAPIKKGRIDATESASGLRYADRLRTVLEVFNARVAVRGFNEEAQRFADKYRVVAGAGSDSHVAQGLGTVKIRMRDFDSPQEFLESLRDADILHKRKSLIYLQSLKFLQTNMRPKTRPAARR